jgi:hypothetical protein
MCKPTATRRRCAISEHDEQVAVFEWAALNEGRSPELALLFATFNGVRISIGAAVKAKAAGNKRGVPDIFLPVARLGKHGLWIEMKVSGGRLSPEQKAWHANLRSQGYHVEVCWTWLEAVNAIETYLTRDGWA